MKLCKEILDLLFPPKCPFCTKLLQKDEEHLCARCDLELPWMEDESGQRPGEFLDDAIAPLWYRDSVRDSHHRFKFGGVRAYAVAYGVLLEQCVRGQLAGPVDVITWAPVSKKRLRKRGYDQSELLARQLGLRLALPVERLVDKVQHTLPQAAIRDETVRRANVLGAYALAPGAQAAGRHVLLVDDVVTTGSTLSECARILRTAGAASVTAVTLAVTPREGSGAEPDNDQEEKK
ncbi:MAG: ComF family protein [Oscillospiraceae bacterium]|nr:ComF family protein [Oscillospiraceae bacterium]